MDTHQKSTSIKEITSLANQFLVAMPSSESDFFEGTLIYLCEHNAEGAMGLVVNRPTDISFAELFSKLELGGQNLKDKHVFIGGPVMPEHGFILHEAGFKYKTSIELNNNLTLSVSRDALEDIACGNGPKNVQVFLGYSGWQSLQLESELARNVWINVDADPEMIFSLPAALRYDAALAKLGITAASLVSGAGHA